MVDDYSNNQPFIKEFPATAIIAGDRRINYSEMLDIRRRLSAIARRDIHAREGKYHIRSLYFDTPEDTALREKLLGVAKREKYRIRCYDGDTSFIRLEKKTKIPKSKGIILI